VEPLPEQPLAEQQLRERLQPDQSLAQRVLRQACHPEPLRAEQLASLPRRPDRPAIRPAFPPACRRTDQLRLRPSPLLRVARLLERRLAEH
jgi:hypothetical protein